MPLIGPKSHTANLALALLRQLEDPRSAVTDVTLHCSDGEVPAHAALLGTCSGLFKEISSVTTLADAHGLFMLDFKRETIQKVLELIYNGQVVLRNERQLVDVQNVLYLLQVDRLDSLVKIKESTAGLKIKHEHNLSSVRSVVYKAQQVAQEYEDNTEDPKSATDEAGRDRTQTPDTGGEKSRKPRILMSQLDPSDLTCDVCSKVFTKLYKLKNHKLIHFKNFPFICSDCGKGFKNKYKLNAHEKNHLKTTKSTTDREGNRAPGNRGKVYNCQHCADQFSRLKDKVSHIREKHKTVHSCIHCQSQFRTKKNLVIHLKVVHNDVEGAYLHSCSVCGKRFSKPSHLEEHKARHNLVLQHACLFCPKRCATKQDLDRHLASHMGETKHTCQLCLKTFVHRMTYMEHVRKHLGQKPYSCKPCNKAFCQFKSLRKHQKMHETKGDATVLVVPSKGSRGLFSYIDHIIRETPLQLPEQKNKNIDSSMYIPGPHYIQSSQSITPLKQMQVITDYTEISRIGFHAPGGGANLDNQTASDVLEM